MAGAAVCATAAWALVGCSLLAGGRPGSEETTQQTQEAACEIVQAEWGWALDPWRTLRDLSSPGSMEQRKVDHLAVIAAAQSVAEKIDEPDVRSVLDTSIHVHQQLADDVWDGYASIPDGQPIVPDDPGDPTTLVSRRFAAYTQMLLVLDTERYELCGGVQDGQTAEQACDIATGDFVDAGFHFNSAASYLSMSDITQADIDEAAGRADAALHEMTIAMAQVTAPEILTELEGMYAAYDDFVRDGIASTQPQEAVTKMSDEDVDAYVAEGEKAQEQWNTRLTSGEEELTRLCGAFD